MLKSFKVNGVSYNFNCLTEINLCKHLVSLERFCSFSKSFNGLNKTELLAKFVMRLLRWRFLRNRLVKLENVKSFLRWSFFPNK